MILERCSVVGVVRFVEVISANMIVAVVIHSHIHGLLTIMARFGMETGWYSTTMVMMRGTPTLTMAMVAASDQVNQEVI